MLYLEDFIELIEQLPQDLRDRFTDMRELDLKVQNTIDTLDTRVRKLFSDARKGKAEETDREYNSIHSSYKQALDDAGEKVLMASQVYDLVDRHLRKLDQELGRFKMELEADCSGITEILERRSTTNEDNSLDLLYNKDSTNNHKRKFGDIERLSTANLTNGGTSSTEKSLTGIFTSLAASYASAKPTPTPPAAATGKQNGISSLHHSKSSPSLSTDSSKDGRGAQAILNAMTAAQKKAEKLGNSLSLSGLMAPSSSSHKQSSSSQSYIDVTGYQSSSSQKSSQSSQSSRIPKSGRRAHKNMGGSQGDSKYPGPSIDWVPDPNEPTYCICNQVSYGEMVGCDNNSCPIEWFHYGCVGLTDAPKGKWYCRDCSVQIKKKRMR